MKDVTVLEDVLLVAVQMGTLIIVTVSAARIQFTLIDIQKRLELM